MGTDLFAPGMHKNQNGPAYITQTRLVLQAITNCFDQILAVRFSG